MEAFDIAISYYQGKLDEVNDKLKVSNAWDSRESYIEDMTLVSSKLAYEGVIRTLTQTKEGTLVDKLRESVTRECPIP